MKKTGNSLILMAFASALLCASTGFAQQTTPNAYQGVSNPPTNDDIVTTSDVPAAAPAAKPSPVVHATQAVPAQAEQAAPASISSHEFDSNNDIVTGPPPSAATETTTASLEKRPAFNPDTDIVSYVNSPDNELAEGTNINARLLEGLSTRETNVGTTFKAQVSSDVYKSGKVIIPAGSELRGRVVGVTQGHHFGSAATLRLRPDLIVLPDGTAYHFYGQVVGSKAPNTRMGSEGGIQPASHLKKNAIEYGAGAGTGALVGAKVAGPTGALVGSLIGAGVITTHLLIQHPQSTEVPKGSVVTFSLTEPMDLTPTRN